MEAENERRISQRNRLMAFEPHLYGHIECREYANSVEIDRMEEMNTPLIAQMRGFLGSLKSLKKETALEIGCGACHVTRDLLQHQFARIDLMD